MCYIAGYKVCLAKAKCRNRVGITIIRKEEAEWQVEVTTIFGPNGVSVTITTGWKHWYVVGTYLPPTTNQRCIGWNRP